MTTADTLLRPGLDDAARSVLFSQAHTINNFSPEPVSDEQLTEIWDLAKWGPSAANFQPLRVLYVKTADSRERLARHMADGNKEKVLAAPAVAVLAADSRYHEHIPYVMPLKAEFKDVLEADEPLRTGMGEFSSAIQAGYFILATRAAGLSAGPMGGFDRAGVDAEFFGDGRWRSILVVNIGYPAVENAHYPRQPRLGHADVLSWA
jgi:3-hydroxypropanoate dehydrogenase